MANFFEKVIDWFKDIADWVQENLGDPAIAAAMRDDLGLKPGEDIPKAKKDQLQQFSDGFDPDKKAFLETIEQLKPIVEALIQLGEQLKDDSGSLSGWDVAYLIGRLSAADSIRLRAPLIYTLGQISLLVSTEPEQITELDPAVLVGVVKGDPEALGSGERLLQRLTALTTVAGLIDALLGDMLGADFLEVYYGWDPAPGSPTPNADLVSARASTFIIRNRGEVGGSVTLTLIGVPSEHGGPGLFLALGGGFMASQTIVNTKYEFDAGLAAGLDFFIPFSSGARDFSANGDFNSYLKVSVLRDQATPNEPALRIGDAGATRLDLGGLGFGVDMLHEGAGFRSFVRKGALIINLGEGDGFLQTLSAGEIKLGFDVGITVDTMGGVRIDGGTLLEATIPVNETVGGFLDLHHVTLRLGPAADGNFDVALEMSTAFGVTLGPFQASIDRIGFQFKFAVREGNLGFLDAAVGFKPPNGVGLLLDAGIVKGGGFLFIDHARGEYAGALELKFAGWGIKAIGVLSTKMPDGSKGFALLLLIYADLPRFHIAFGIFFEGIGGIIGLQHGVDIQAIQEGMPSGLFDDILFPANPVADAPRIINRLRVVFPIRQHALLIGPFLRLTWGTPAVGEIKLGLLLALDNVLGGDDPVSLNSILLLGQLRIGLPESRRGDVARIICDFFGYLDFNNKRFGFYARLRDSKLVGSIEITGSLVLQIDFGDNPSFVMAVGGFHPRFKDLPAGLPSKLDRVGIKFNIAIVKVSITFYLAITSATVQFGAELRIEIKLGPVRIDGWIGFDALIYYEPEFRFEIDFRAGVTVKFKSFTLMSVDVKGTLMGPGLWRISGSFKFSVLFWDIEKSFDEQWGDKPALDVPATSVAALMQAAYSNPDNWAAALPAGSDSLVTISARKGETELLAHPLGQLRVSQKIAPLGLTLEKYGETPIAGPNRFDFEKVVVNGATLPNPEMTREHLARASYIKLSEEDRLSKPSFETFDVGVAVGSSGFIIPTDAVTEGDLSYETRYLEPRPNFLAFMTVATLQTTRIGMAALHIQARSGAAAGSQLRRFDSQSAAGKIKLSEPPLTVVNTVNMNQSAAFSGQAVTNRTLAEQQFDTMVKGSRQIVELFELTS